MELQVFVDTFSLIALIASAVSIICPISLFLRLRMKDRHGKIGKKIYASKKTRRSISN